MTKHDGDDRRAASRAAFAAAGGHVGPHGPIHTDLAEDYPAAIARLTADADGEVPGALSHPDIGAIDLIWGTQGTSRSDGAGLAKLLVFHPEVVRDLPVIVSSMAIVKRSPKRIQLQSSTHGAVVRLDYDSRRKQWLLTACERKAAPGATQDGPASPLPPGRTRYSRPEPRRNIGDPTASGNASGVRERLRP